MTSKHNFFYGDSIPFNLLDKNGNSKNNGKTLDQNKNTDFKENLKQNNFLGLKENDDNLIDIFNSDNNKKKQVEDNKIPSNVINIRKNPEVSSKEDEKLYEKIDEESNREEESEKEFNFKDDFPSQKKLKNNKEKIEKEEDLEKEAKNLAREAKTVDEIEVEKWFEEKRTKHPYILRFNKPVEYPLLANTGWFCCRKNCQDSDIDKYGLGLVSYFKLLKALIICFSIISVINIPIYLGYFNSSSSMNNIIHKTSFGNTLMSILNLNLASFYCLKLDISVLQTFNGNYSLPLDCGKYSISGLSSFGLSETVEIESTNQNYCYSNSLTDNINLLSTCNVLPIFSNYFENSCNNKNICNFFFDTNQVISNCVGYTKQKTFFLTYQCSNNNFTTIFDISNETFSYLIISIDVLSMMILILLILLLPSFIDKYKAELNKGLNYVSEFTIHLKNINIESKFLNDELDSLSKHFNEVIIESGLDYVPFEQNIFDINYCYTNYQILEMIQNKNLLSEELAKNIKYLHHFRRYDIQDKISEYEMNVKKIKETFASELRNLQTCKKRVDYIDDLFITFIDSRSMEYIKDIYDLNIIQRISFYLICQCNRLRKFHYKNSWLNIDRAVEPSNIKWENMPFSEFQRFLRKGLVILMGIAILLISLICVTLVKFKDDSLNSVLTSNIDCLNVNYTDSDLIAEKSLVSALKVKTACFCQSSIYSLGTDNTAKLTLSDNSFPCSNYVDIYSSYNYYKIVLAVVLPILNLAINSLKMFTNFQRNKTIYDEDKMNIISLLVFKVINTGIMILIINAKISYSSNIPGFLQIFQGNYTEFTRDWFQNVGYTLILIVFVNIFLSTFYFLVEFFFKTCLRCIDGEFSGVDGSKSTIVSKEDYFDLYVGPIFSVDLRYSNHLSIIFISLLFSSGMPIMYILVLIYLLLCYWIDKFLCNLYLNTVMRFYKIPPKFDIQLSGIFSYTMFYAVLCHFMFAFWLYGTPVNSNASFISCLLIKIKPLPSFICGIFIALMILLIVGKYLFWGCIKNCRKGLNFSFICCRKTNKVYNTNKTENVVSDPLPDLIGDCLSLKGLYKTYEIRKLVYRQIMREKNSQEDLKKVYISCFLYDREHLKKKLKLLTDMKYEDIDKDFDMKIKNIMQKFDKNEKSKIREDFSYNLVHVDDYEGYVLNNYYLNDTE